MGKGFLYGSPRDEPAVSDIKVAAFQIDTASPANYLQAVGTTAVPGLTRANGAVSVASTATVILAASDLAKKRIIKNNGTQTVYLGDASVTTANGMPIDPGEAWVDEDGCDAWYGIVASSTADVRYITYLGAAS